MLLHISARVNSAQFSAHIMASLKLDATRRFARQGWRETLSSFEPPLPYFTVLYRRIPSGRSPAAPNGRDAGRPKAAALADHDTHNSSLGSKLSSFLNYFCPPVPTLRSQLELGGWLRPAGLPALIVAAFTRRVQF